jgi:hypothetical protein
LSLVILTFRASRYLGEMIGLEYTNHQLPWHPPLCMETIEEPTLSPAVLMKLRQFLPPSKPLKVQPEPELMVQLLSYVNRESGMEEELGQRILTALGKVLLHKFENINMLCISCMLYIGYLFSHFFFSFFPFINKFCKIKK